MRREYQSNKRQCTDNYNGNTGYNGSNNGSGNQFGSYQAQISQAQSVSYGGCVIYPMPPHMGTHMIPPPPPPSQYRSVNQVSQFQKQQHHDDNATQISNVTTGGSIMGGSNKQASLQSSNNNCQVQNVFSKQRIGRATAVSEPATNNYATNESDTNYDTCFLGTNFIPIAYTNLTADIYPYSDAYMKLENVPIISGAIACDHPNGNTYILIFHEPL